MEERSSIERGSGILQSPLHRGCGRSRDLEGTRSNDRSVEASRQKKTVRTSPSIPRRSGGSSEGHLSTGGGWDLGGQTHFQLQEKQGAPHRRATTPPAIQPVLTHSHQTPPIQNSSTSEGLQPQTMESLTGTVTDSNTQSSIIQNWGNSGESLNNDRGNNLIRWQNVYLRTEN